MPIVLRLIKGSELTFAELDGNFQDLDNRTDALEAIDAGTRLTRLEAAGTPIYFDSDDVMVMLDSIWAGGVYSYLATTDSIGLASFDSDHFNVNGGHVTIKLAGYTPSDSAGIASFDSSNFVVSAGHVTINPNSAAGRVAGTTIIDSTGVASFDSAEFNVSSDGHVTHNSVFLDSAVRSRFSVVDNGIAGSFEYSDSTGVFTYTGSPLATTGSVGVASFNSSDFTVSGSGQVSLAGGGGISPISSITAVGSFMFLQAWGMPNGTKYEPGNNIPGSQLRYGRFANGIFTTANVGFWRNGNTNTSPVEVAYYNSSNNSSSTVPGTWKLLGPGCMGYISGSGSSTYGLLQRVL
jgi:hypothetical protein